MASLKRVWIRTVRNPFFFSNEAMIVEEERELVNIFSDTPGKRFELLRCRAPVAFKATALPV